MADTHNPFEPIDLPAWRAVVERDLRGADFEHRLVRTLADGLTIQPLYTADDRPLKAPICQARGWQHLASQRIPNPQLPQHVVDDIAGGADGIELDGIVLWGATNLASVIGETTVPVCLRKASLGQALLLASRGGADDELGYDPLGSWATHGQLSGSIDEALVMAGTLAARTHQRTPNARALLVDTEPYHVAGAGEIYDLALALATGVEYLRVGERAGLSVAAAADQITFSLALPTTFFQGIAKIRALRLLWARVLDVCGASTPARIRVRPTWRSITRRDPWINILRTTVATFAGMVGGADAIVPLPFDAAMGTNDDSARRLARNTPIILAEESHLRQVQDVASGSYFLESLTHRMAKSAWAQFQECEASGGVIKEIATGRVAAHLEVLAKRRKKNVLERRQPIVGISVFPDLTEIPKQVVGIRFTNVSEHPPIKVDLEKLSGIDDIINALKSGVTVQSIRAALWREFPTKITGLATDQRDAEPFEWLRDKIYWMDPSPTVFLAKLGTVAEYTARSMFAQDFFGVGGFVVIEGSGDSLVTDFKQSGTSIVCLCSTDALYAEQGPALIEELRQAGAKTILLAGKIEIDGVDLTIHRRTNVFNILIDLLELEDAYEAVED